MKMRGFCNYKFKFSREEWQKLVDDIFITPTGGVGSKTLQLYLEYPRFILQINESKKVLEKLVDALSSTDNLEHDDQYNSTRSRIVKQVKGLNKLELRFFKFCIEHNLRLSLIIGNVPQLEEVEEE